jgi:hypothetical protein
MVTDSMILAMQSGGLGITGTVRGSMSYSQTIPKTSVQKIPSATIKKRNAKIATQGSAPCRRLMPGQWVRNYLNYDGDIREFQHSCTKFKTVMKYYQSLITTTKFTKANILDNKSRIGEQFKTLMKAKIVGTPYLLAGRAEYTPEFAYRAGSFYGADRNRAAINQNLAVGFGKRLQMDFGGKTFTEYYKGRGYVEDVAGKGLRFKDAFDCSGIVVWLAAHSGFAPGVNAKEFAKATGPSGQRVSMLPLTIEQWAHTPGASAFTKKGHTYVSAGEGFKMTKKGGFRIKVYEAGYYYRGTRPTYKTLRYPQSGKVTTGKIGNNMQIGILRSFLYANYSGDYDKR